MVTKRLWSALALGLLLAVATSVAACFTIDFKNGQLKCADVDDMGGGKCPLGTECVKGFCFVSPDLGGGSQIPPADAGPPSD